MKVFVEFAADSSRSHRSAPFARPSSRRCPLPRLLENEPSRFRLLCRAVFNSLDRDSALRRSYVRQLWRGEGCSFESRGEGEPDGSAPGSADDML
jgi:hypothetical protein